MGRRHQRDVLRPLTATAGNEGAPSVSPDGRTIAFHSEATDFDLVEVPLDGSPLRPFLSSTRNEFDPAASPVNTQYAFVTDRAGRLEIWLQNEEGYLQQPLVTEPISAAHRRWRLGRWRFRRTAGAWRFSGSTQSEKATLAGPRSGFLRWPVARPVALVASDDVPGCAVMVAGWRMDRVSSRGESANGRWRKCAWVAVRAPVISQIRHPPVCRAAAMVSGWPVDLCETLDGLTMVSADGAARASSATGWLAYAWEPDSRRIYGLRPTDDQHHFMLVSLDAQTGGERVINANLGAIPQAIQPIRGFSRLRDRGFLTSIARVRSDIYLIEGFRLPPSWWERLWPFGTAP